MIDRLAQATFSFIYLLSTARFALFFLGSIELLRLDYSFVLYMAGSLLLHQACKPYVGLVSLSLKTHENKKEFVPLKHWMIPQSNRELNGFEYEELLNESLSGSGLMKLKEIKLKGSISVYDAVNLAFYEHQVGKIIDYKIKEEQLRQNIKGGF